MDELKYPRQVVYGLVYAPYVLDTDGMYMTEEDIMTSAHNFLRDLRLYSIDHEHTLKLVDGASIVESFIARAGDPDFDEGSWVIGVHVPNKEDWEKILSKGYNGFSLQGVANLDRTQVRVRIPTKITGTTSVDGSNPHSHTFTVYYAENGTFLGGETDVVLGHKHLITSGVETVEANGHSHRFVGLNQISVEELQ